MEMFGNEDLNQTGDNSFQKVAHVYTAEEIALMLGALGAMVASIIYSVKNIKHSTCCLGLFSCDQRTELPVSKDSIVETSIV
tara:strand:+ start:582 stop:827 length:246 start_codon:yes stop_codon:yes gene_type:complete